jgi:hypothetical protein
VAAVGATLLVTGPAAAGQVLAWLGRAPVTTEEADRMQMIYRGQPLTVSEIQGLQAQGKAMVTVFDPVSQSNGRAHVFDTSAEADAWACANIPGMSDSRRC